MRSIQQFNHLARKERRRIDVEYRGYLNFRRDVENSKSQVDAKAEQLKAIAEIATVLAGKLKTVYTKCAYLHSFQLKPILISNLASFNPSLALFHTYQVLLSPAL